MSTHETVLSVLNNHRSVRAFTDQPLPDGLLDRLLETGFRASTSSNMQATTVISMTDPAVKKPLAALCADQKQIHQSAAFLVFCADLHRLQLACAMRDVPNVDISFAESYTVAVVDTALVMQNVAVAAESAGLGICMIGAMRNNPSEVGELLSLPTGVLALAGFCIGYPADESEIKPRLSPAAKVSENAYPDEDTLRRGIDNYDQVQSAWYAERGMHDKDTRWSAVMSRRVPGMAKRADLTTFLHEQGLNVR